MGGCRRGRSGTFRGFRAPFTSPLKGLLRLSGAKISEQKSGSNSRQKKKNNAHEMLALISDFHRSACLASGQGKEGIPISERRGVGGGSPRRQRPRSASGEKIQSSEEPPGRAGQGGSWRRGRGGPRLPAEKPGPRRPTAAEGRRAVEGVPAGKDEAAEEHLGRLKARGGWSRPSGAAGSGNRRGSRAGKGMATTHTWMSTFTYMSGWDKMVRPEPRST